MSDLFGMSLEGEMYVLFDVLWLFAAFERPGVSQVLRCLERFMSNGSLTRCSLIYSLMHIINNMMAVMQPL
jgi:hypothetical protein